MRAAALFLIAAAAFGQAIEAELTTLAKRALAQRGEKLSAAGRADLAARQKYVKEKILASIGGLPAIRSPLNARVTKSFSRDGYRVENVIYESLPGFYVTANLYVPTTGQAPYPALLGVAGHSANGKASATYQHVWISLARRGFVVLAFDPPGQGERSATFDEETGASRIGIGVAEHIMEGTQCLLTGHHFARYEIWDGIRSVDYLISRSEVDPNRIAVAGNSGGGTQSAYLAVLEPRLAAIVSSCYMTSWEQLWDKPGAQDAEQVFPGFLRDGLDFSDFALAAAPRPFMMTTAIQDFFPIAGARKTYDEIKRFYRAFDVEAKAGYFEYDDTHGWSKPRREAAYRWLEKWLKGKDDPGIEAPLVTEPEENLYATATGQVRTSLAGETIQSINAKEAERLYAARRGPSREIVRDRLGLEKYPAAALPGSKPVVIYLNSIGDGADDRRAIAAAGFDVVTVPDAVNPAPGPREAGYTGPYKRASSALLVGKTLPGIQVSHVLSTIDGLGNRPVRIFGKGNAAVVALYAAYLEPRIESVALERMPVSYLAIARARFPRSLIDIVVPGVLKDFDLPDLAAALAPRPVYVVDTRHPNGLPMLTPAAALEYPKANVAPRPEGWTFEKIYAAFLQR